MTDRSLRGKVVVITGASSGFGKGAALRFAEEGASLVLAARRDRLLDELGHECGERGARAIAVAADVSNPEAVQKLAEVAVGSFGRIDVWVNNAGVGAIGQFERIPDLLGTVYGSYYAYRQFLKQEAGILINIASELGRHTVPYYASYTASKHGVVGLGDSLRQEIEQRGLAHVHVCTVMPTAMTPFFDHVASYTGHEVRAPQPLHDPDDVVQAVVRLARDPEDKEVVGSDGLVKIFLKHVLPPVAEKIAAWPMHQSQDEDAPVAAGSPGAVRSPIAAGTEVSAGRIAEREKAESR